MSLLPPLKEICKLLKCLICGNLKIFRPYRLFKSEPLQPIFHSALQQMLHSEDHDAYRSVHMNAFIQLETLVELDFSTSFHTEWNHFRKTSILAIFRRDPKRNRLGSARKGVDFARLQLI